MVDWSIFWNNIFPGLLLIISSSLGAYFVVHRYQRKKYNKEIRDELIHQEHSLLNKYFKLVRIFFDIYDTFDSSLKDLQKTVQEMDDKLNKKYKKLTSTTEMTEENGLLERAKEKTEKIISVLSKREELLSQYDILFSEILLDVNLLYKRLQSKLGVKDESLEFIYDFIKEIETWSSKALRVFENNEQMKEKEDILKEIQELNKFFTQAEEIILKSKIKFK